MKRSFFQYVSLNVLGALGLSGYILADTLFVAHRLGTDGLAALNLAISVFGLINGLGLMLGIGGATRYAICRTQGDGVRADRAFSRALACGGALGGLLALAGLLWAVPLARLLGAEGAILPMCSVYLRTVLLFAPCFLLNHILTAFVRNDGNPKLAMAAMLLGSLSNIVLDYVFLYPMDMGIFGAALATGIAPVVGLCVSSLHILTRRSRFRLRPFRPALRPLADLAGLGSAAFLNECSSGLVLVVFNLLTLRLAGTLGVAAYGIVANLALMALALFTGVNQGVQPLVSLAHGRGDAAGVRTLCRMALGLALCAGLCMAALATGIAPVVGLCVSSLHILTRRSRFRLRPFRPALRPLADLAGLGSAAFLNECSSGLVLVVFNLLTLRLAGTLGVAAYGIVANLALMALALFTGVNQGVQPLVSLAHGRGDAAGVRTLCRMALGLALCAGLCMAALAFFAAGPLVSLFNRDGDPALQQMAEQGLRLYFLGFPFAGLNLVTASFLGAAEHPSRSLRLSLLRGFVAIVAAALLLAALLGLTGVWLALPAAEGAVLLVSLRLSRSLRRARPEPAPQAITTALR